jgi:hypothetical protein
MKILVFLAVFFATQFLLADAAIFSGSDVKILKNNLDMNGKAKLLSGTVDPTTTATNAPKGSFYFNSSSAKYYRKLDAGSSTNWVLVGDLHPPKNALDNPDWEVSTASWSASGGTYQRATTTPAFGIGYASWSPTAASQSLQSDAINISGKYFGFAGQNGVASCRIKVASAGVQHYLKVVSGSGNIAYTPIYLDSTNYQKTSLNFVWPSSGSAAVALESGATSGPVSVDDCFFGLADNIIQTNIDTDLQSYTPIVSGLGAGSGTSSFWYRRVGDSVFILFDFTKDGTPGSGGTQVTFSLPSGLTINTSKGPTGSVTSYGAVNSNGVEGSANSFVTSTVMYESTTTFAISNPGTGNLRFEGADFRAGSNVSGFAIIPVLGWSSSLVYKPDQFGWRADAQIYGAAINLGSADISTYTEMTDAGLTVQQHPGSAPVGAVCQTTNSSVVGNLTCASGNEGVGLTFNIPKAGSYKACIAFPHYFSPGAIGNQISTTFQLVETPYNAQTILQEGHDKSMSAVVVNVASEQFIFPHKNCGTFEFATAGQKTIRLMFEQDVTGSVGSNFILADQDAASGQRDIHMTVEAITAQSPAPILVNSVMSPSTGPENIARVTTAFCNSSPCTISSQNGAVSSVTRSATGTYAVNFISGTFASSPTCVCSTISSTNNSWCQGYYASNTFNAYALSSNVTNADEGIQVMCMGPK